MFLSMRLPGMCTLPSARTFAGRTVLRLRPIGCTKAKDLIVPGFWMAASLRNRSRNFLPLPIARPPNVESTGKLVELTYTAAFLAGMISFLSPCVLPLVPGFVGTMTGLSAEQLQEDSTWHWRTILLNAVLFVLGFSVLFISLGASAGVVGRFLSAHREWLNRIAGAGIVFFGLVLLGWLPIRFLHRDIRFQREIRQSKFRSFLLWLAFAFCWTPCAGPALVAMLMMAATQNSVWRGTSLLAVYSAGFGIPFIFVALSLSRFLTVFQRLRRHLLWVERFAGAMLVSVGVLLFFDKLADLAFYLSRFNRLVW